MCCCARWRSPGAARPGRQGCGRCCGRGVRPRAPLRASFPRSRGRRPRPCARSRRDPRNTLLRRMREPSVRAATVPAAPQQSDRTPAGRWDLLLACVALYLATAVGRVHELFPALLPLKPTLVSALLAVALYLLQQTGARRFTRLRGAPTTCVLGLLLWVALAAPGSLSPGIAFRYLTDYFIKTVVMYAVIAGCVRSVRDVERLVLAYFAATVIYGAVVLMRFQLGAGDDWRLGHLYNYDANDFATLIATAM